uniref:C3H1-type domain-containing protein n=2 Tax=Trichobilharzia regenti TaxID=157069 RepID=A0AA85KHD5_TRIRE|nr:unnamed protein product [Trichobilharzia regenti]
MSLVCNQLMATIDFEEGEVEDVSGSDHEDSDQEYEERTPPKVGLHKHSKRRRRGGGKTRNPHRDSSVLAVDYKVDASHMDLGNGSHKRPREKLQILEFLSENEDETDSVDRERVDDRKPSKVNRKKKKRKRDRQPSQSRCKYFMDGRCSKGSSCPFLHDVTPTKKHELCKFYAVGVCSKESSCSYLHGEFPCKFFHLTNDCHHGEECKFSHAPLTDFTRSLLEKLASKHNTDRPSVKSGQVWQAELSQASLSGRSWNDNHGDIDYRFDQKSLQIGTSDKELINPGFNPQRMPSLAPNLFAPICAPGPRPFRPEHDLVRVRGMRPFNMIPGEQMPPIVYPKDERCFPPPNPYGPITFPPQHTMPTAACAPTVNGFRPPSLLDTPPRCPQPRTMLPRSRMMDPGNVRFPRFRPRGETLCPLGIRPPMRPIFNSLQEEDIVSSELDKMAALLASSKPINDERKDDSAVPPTSPLGINDPQQRENSSFENETDALAPDDPVDDTAVPEPAASAQLSMASPQGPIPWRLIPLDMSVKIPYPLMQLPISELPYRFEDPRLRGQLATLRPQPQSRLSSNSDSENPKHNDHSEPHIQNETNPSGNTDDSSSTSTNRRPVKLQLHEMANTFANSSTEHLNPSGRQGDRSYLDDPRFRRRRIMTSSSTTLPTNTVNQCNSNNAMQTAQECSD